MNPFNRSGHDTEKLAYGAITHQDLARALPHYRIKMPTGELSNWMPALTGFAGSSRTNMPLSIGTQVACLIGLYDGLILGALNCVQSPTTSSADTLDRTKYSDGTVIEYNAKTSQLNIHCTGRVVINVSGDISITSPTTVINTQQTHNGDVDISGDVSISGSLNVGAMTTTGGLTSKGTAGGGGATITGLVKVSGDVLADGISLKSHSHGGVQAGGDSTAGPQ